MKAAVYHGPRDVRIESVAEPDPGPGEVRLKVVLAGICGTDAGEYAYGPRHIPLNARHRASGHLGPLIIGHEILGRVEEIGEGVEGLSVGERVVPGAGMWCGHCRWCTSGSPNLCESYYTLGLQVDGGLAEYVNAPAPMCRPVPEGCSDPAAAMAQPMAVAIHSARRVGVEPGSSVAVIGVGGIGFFVLAAALFRGAGQAVAVDIDAGRLARAEVFGATAIVDAGGADAAAELLELTGGLGFDVVVEASGAAPSPGLAQRVVRRGGAIALLGLHAEPRALDLTDLTLREVDLISSLAHVCDVDLPEALDGLTDPRLGPGALDRVIELGALVEEGLEPLVDGKVNGKIIVDVG